jgi:hypothetical protein
MKRYTHFFQFNIPADNHLNGYTDRYINVVAYWDGETFYTHDKSPMVFFDGINLTFADCIQVKDWHKAYKQIETIAKDHFADLAKQERINQARAILAVEENPILSRLQIAEA